MGPKKRGARKRTSEEALGGEKHREGNEEEAEERGDRRRKNRGNNKYIGAHVGIQGNAILLNSP